MLFDQKPSLLDNEIKRLVRELDAWHPTSDEYATILEKVSKLRKLRDDEKSSGVSPDTLVMAVTNLVGILLIIKHERFEIITSRAMNLISKTK